MRWNVRGIEAPLTKFTPKGGTTKAPSFNVRQIQPVDRAEAKGERKNGIIIAQSACRIW